MFEQIEPYLFTIGLEILKILGGVLIPVLTIYGAIYKKKWEERAKRKAVEDKINQLVLSGNQVEFFSSMEEDGKIITIMDSIEPYIMELGLTITEAELMIMIEQAMSIPKTLMMSGMKLGLMRKDEVK